MPRAAAGPGAPSPKVLPAYLLHGEDAFQAGEFLDGLIASAASGGEAAAVEKFSLADADWREALDEARSLPMFFSPWRFVVVEAGNDDDLTSAEEAGLAAYLASPSERTTLAVRFSDVIRKTGPLFKAFASRPSSSVVVREFLPLKGRGLDAWVMEKFASLGKRVSSGAFDLLLNSAENSSGRLDREIEKIATFVGDKRLVEEEDVDLLRGGFRRALNWELTAALEKRSAGQALGVLHRIFAEGDKEKAVPIIVGILAGFVRDLVLARTAERAGEKSREEIFTELKPAFVKACRGNFPDRACSDYFVLAGRPELPGLIAGLERLDRRVKTTDIPPRAMIETWVVEFCRGGSEPGFTSRGRG
jgi:DNA polymerase-3 subunit delta